MATRFLWQARCNAVASKNIPFRDQDR